MKAKKLTNDDLKKAAPEYWMPKLEICRFNKNCEAYIDSYGYLNATSHDWWKIICEKNGLYFFNWYSYSSSTRKHQYKISSLVRELGIDYISVSYSADIGCTSIEKILQDKINELYTRENSLALSKATKYAVYSESEFNELLTDIKTIAASLKINDKKLDSMLLEAQDKADKELITKLVDDHERKETMKRLRKENESLEAIAL